MRRRFSAFVDLRPSAASRRSSDAQVLLGGEPPALHDGERLAVLVGDLELGLGDRVGRIWTTGAARVLTSVVPLRSTMLPRGASILILRTRLSRAWLT